MTPTEAIASIRASIAAGYSPSLSDIEVLVIVAKRYRVLCAALTADSVEASLFNQFHEDVPKTAEELDRLCDSVIAALTTQSPRNENG